MLENADTSPTRRFEATPAEFNPDKDPALRRVIVKTEVIPGVGIEQQGWTTDIQGAKVDLQQIAQHNVDRRARKGEKGPSEYERAYFTTQSGTIYCARNLEDGAWEVEASNDKQINVIREPAILEVGQRFQSPHLRNGQPELDTSPVQNITLVSRHTKVQEMGSKFSSSETDIGTQFVRALQTRGGTIR